MEKTSVKCQFCENKISKYTCPKCNAPYCSVDCYKSVGHLKCSEEFYKSCIQEEISISDPDAQNDMHKMYDILKRMRESDAGFEPEYFDELDSDDDVPEKVDKEGNIDGVVDEYEDEVDIGTRLQGININDADEVWQHLTNDERQEFEKLVANGDIMKLVPTYTPWWIKPKESKIVEISKVENKLRPHISKSIPMFSEICKKEPSPCVHYNLWNILTAYTCVVRFFAGEHLTSPAEAAAHLINLSTALKYGTNFEDAEDAIISVEMEAITTRNILTDNGVLSGINFLLVESREQLQSDARQIMSSYQSKLAALSDITTLMQLAKKLSKTNKNEKKDFQKLYALCAGSLDLNKTKLQQLIKKIEFLLSYVNRDYNVDVQ